MTLVSLKWWDSIIKYDNYITKKPLRATIGFGFSVAALIALTETEDVRPFDKANEARAENAASIHRIRSHMATINVQMEFKDHSSKTR